MQNMTVRREHRKRILKTRHGRMRLIERAGARQIPGDKVLGLRIALARIVARSHIRVRTSRVECFAEPVRNVPGETVPGWPFHSDARGIEVGVGRILYLAPFKESLVRTA